MIVEPPLEMWRELKRMKLEKRIDDTALPIATTLVDEVLGGSTSTLTFDIGETKTADQQIYTEMVLGSVAARLARVGLVDRIAYDSEQSNPPELKFQIIDNPAD